MTQNENPVISGKRAGLSNNKKLQLRIDMTPMVDLGFILIAFFIFTTTLTTPKSADLFMPKDEGLVDPPKLPKSLALTLLLDENNKIYYYHGDLKEAIEGNEIFETNYSTYHGIGRAIRQKQKNIDASGAFKEGRNGMMMIIKPTSGSVYKNLIDALDEIVINDVRKYAIVEPGPEDLNYIRKKTGSGF